MRGRHLGARPVVQVCLRRSGSGCTGCIHAHARPRSRWPWPLEVAPPQALAPPRAARARRAGHLFQTPSSPRWHPEMVTRHACPPGHRGSDHRSWRRRRRPVPRGSAGQSARLLDELYAVQGRSRACVRAPACVRGLPASLCASLCTSVLSLSLSLSLSIYLYLSLSLSLSLGGSCPVFAFGCARCAAMMIARLKQKGVIGRLRAGQFVKLTWLVLGGDPAARSHRVEQLTAL